MRSPLCAMLTCCRRPRLSLSGGEDRLLRLHVQQVHPGSPRLSAGQDCELINRFSSSALLHDAKKKTSQSDAALISRLQSGQTVSIDAKCDEPTLLGNVLDEIKQTFSQCWLCPTALCDLCPAPLLHLVETQHNHVTQKKKKTLRLALFSTALFISP